MASPRPGSLLNSEMAPHLLDRLLHDRQTQSGPLGRIWVAPEEPLQDPPVHLRGNPQAVVRHFDPRLVGIRRTVRTLHRQFIIISPRLSAHSGAPAVSCATCRDRIPVLEPVPPRCLAVSTPPQFRSMCGVMPLPTTSRRIRNRSPERIGTCAGAQLIAASGNGSRHSRTRTGAATGPPPRAKVLLASQ